MAAMAMAALIGISVASGETPRRPGSATPTSSRGALVTGGGPASPAAAAAGYPGRTAAAAAAAVAAAAGAGAAARPITARRLAERARNEFLDAASMHDRARVLAALRGGISVNAANERGWTALMEAAYTGTDHRTAVLLLEHGAYPGLVNRDGHTAADIAGARNNVSLARLLASARDAHAARAAAAAVARAAGRVQMADWWLRECARSSDLGALRLFLAHPDSLSADSNAPDAAGVTALMHAAASGDHRIVALLLERGAGCGCSADQWGMTPLMYAAKRGHADIVQLLLASGTGDAVAVTRVGAGVGAAPCDGRCTTCAPAAAVTNDRSRASGEKRSRRHRGDAGPALRRARARGTESRTSWCVAAAVRNSHAPLGQPPLASSHPHSPEFGVHSPPGPSPLSRRRGAGSGSTDAAPRSSRVACVSAARCGARPASTRALAPAASPRTRNAAARAGAATGQGRLARVA